MAEALYDHGVVFDRTDIDRFLATQIGVCWNGSCDAPTRPLPQRGRRADA
jgi:hypothetical protein